MEKALNNIALMNGIHKLFHLRSPAAMRRKCATSSKRQGSPYHLNLAEQKAGGKLYGLSLIISSRGAVHNFSVESELNATLVGIMKAKPRRDKRK